MSVGAAGNAPTHSRCIVFSLAAVREAWEEIGLRVNAITLLGRLSFVNSKANLLVAPVVALVDESRFTPRLNAREVDSLFVVPLSLFAALAAPPPGEKPSWTTFTFHFDTVPIASTVTNTPKRETFTIFGSVVVVIVVVAHVATAVHLLQCSFALRNACLSGALVLSIAA